MRRPSTDSTRSASRPSSSNPRLIESSMPSGANTSPTDYAPFQQLRLARFDGASWVPFGDVITR